MRILCYADNAILLTDCEGGLQWLLQAFKKEAQGFNVEISTSTIKCMVIAREPAIGYASHRNSFCANGKSFSGFAIKFS